MGSDWAAAARLVRRTGFGATGDAVDAALKEGTGAYVDRILGADPNADPGAKKTPKPTFAPAPPAPSKNLSTEQKKAQKKQRNGGLRDQDDQLTRWWIRRMLAVEQPFGEKATFVWHAHFATSLRKVKLASAMLAQNEKQRTMATGDFGALAYAMLLDAATQKWLDNQKNTVKGPNENLSREFMEIFTLGHNDGYTETDVREGAKALTGFRMNARTGALTTVPRLHDTSSKTFLGRTGDLGAKEYCDAVLARPGCPAYVATRMYNAYVSNNAPSKDTLTRLLSAYGAQRDLGAMFRTMFTDPSFADAEGTYILGPVEWLIGAVRALRPKLEDDQQVNQLGATMDALGQKPFYPPSVGGWASGAVWMNTAAADLRFRAAGLLAARSDLSAITGSTTSRLDTVAHLLAVGSWSDDTLRVLKGVANQPTQLVSVAVNTPEYLVH